MNQIFNIHIGILEMTMQSSQIGPDEPLRAPIEIIRMVQVHCRNSMVS